MLLGESVFSNFAAATQPAAAPATQQDATVPQSVQDEALNELFGISPLEVQQSSLDSVFDTTSALATDIPMFEPSPVSQQQENAADDMATWEPLFPEQQSQQSQQPQLDAAADAELMALIGAAPAPAPASASDTPNSASASVQPSVAASPLDDATPSAAAPLFETRSLSTPNLSAKEKAKSSMKRARSAVEDFTSSSPSSHKKKPKVDKFGCVSYTRKQRSAPLEPVVAQGSDNASLKRARNTEAARRSRARKMQRMIQLEDKCETLAKENEELKAQVELLKRQLGQQ